MSSEKPDRHQGDGQNRDEDREAVRELEKQASQQSNKDGPPGGYDATKIPHAPPGYTVKITFHRATNLPMADLSTLSSDPYLQAQLETDLPRRHKEDPILTFRTSTIWKATNPEWNEEWIIGHVPASGFKLKARIYDEDMNDSNDRLGNVHIHVGHIDDKWPGMKEEGFKIKKKTGSKRAYLLRAFAVCMGRAEEMSGRLTVSIEVMGKTEGGEGGRMYTIGPNYWYKHKSPLLGRLTGSRNPQDDHKADEDDVDVEPADGSNSDSQSQGFLEKHMPHATKSGKSHNEGPRKKSGRYNFEANQFQLRGPVPQELYHRYVEFRPFIHSLFTSKGLRGLLMNRALHMQHDRVYNFNRQTEYGSFDGPGDNMTRKFLELVHYDKGGRIYTYVITLDGLMRFTETGKQFGIDMLSKHTMHSDADMYVAFSGEFFIRRLKHADREPPEAAQAKKSRRKHRRTKSDESDESTPISGKEAGEITGNTSHPPKKFPGGPPSEAPPQVPAQYEIIIDNDSGTYRPNAKLLPIFRHFLEDNFPGLKVVTLDCQKDAKLMEKLKGEQRAVKEAETGGKKYTQVDDASSLSSEDIEAMQERAQEEQEEDGEQEARRGSKHKLGEALGPILGNHDKMRKVVGA